MLSRTLSALQVPHTHLRKASNFNKYPALKVKPFGVGGNAMLAIGVTVFTASMIVTYQAGYIKKRIEVLEESEMMGPDCNSRLKVAIEKLTGLVEENEELKNEEVYQVAKNLLVEVIN
uniref:Tubulin-specific chaperone A n=1 Tax=Phallusia mammillata TaxID=59560 RepID=A0A6F9DTS9_9ASCI|nr:tubulin-specific chaperone A-like [Phallusia mammillata]